MLENLERHYAPGGMTLVGADGQEFTATLKPEQLVTASVEFGKVQRVANTVDTPSADPWQHCPACAVTSRTTTWSGEPRLVWLMTGPLPAVIWYRNRYLLLCSQVGTSQSAT